LDDDELENPIALTKNNLKFQKTYIFELLAKVFLSSEIV